MIKSLSIRNYKCFQDEVFRLSNLNVLTGLNGAGKSSVLQALLLLRQSYEMGLLKDVGLALNGDYVRIGAGKDALYEDASDDAFGFCVDFTGTAAEWMFVYKDGGDVPANEDRTVAESVFTEALFSENFQYLQAERVGPRTSFPSSAFSVKKRRWLGNSGEFTTYFLSTFGRKIKVHPKLRYANSDQEDLIDQVELWLGEISPGARLHSREFEGTDSVNLEYSFTFGDDTSGHFRTTNVGFGITYVLPVLVAVLSLSAKPDSILLLENPEAHVHPSGQLAIGRMLALLAEAGIQVLLETHSDHIINGIRLAVHEGELSSERVRTYFFAREVSRGNCPSIVSEIGMDEQGRFKSRPAGFFDQFNAALDRFLEPSKKYGSTPRP
jgi:predicted ATPase